eukprot:5735563-Alexandrium_andersonii.AAC.1
MSIRGKPRSSPQRRLLSRPGSRARSEGLVPLVGLPKGLSLAPLPSFRTRRARWSRNPLRLTELFGTRGL